MVYLDNSATTPVCPQAAEAALQMMTENFGNPSSLHTLGIRAEESLADTRARLADTIGCTPAEITFTSGGTEANNLAILGAAIARQRRGRHIVVSAIEHASVSAPIERLEQQGFEVTRVLPQADGRILPADVLSACRADTVLVSVMLVNNETGAVFPMDRVAAKIRKIAPLAALHIDAVQAVGKIPVNVKKLDADLLTVSGHKLYAPKGVGALYCRKGVRLTPPSALGGGQEKSLRSGTENTAGIAAFGAALAALPTTAESAAHYSALRQHLLERLNGRSEIRWHLPEDGVPYIVNFSVMGLRSETLIHFLAEREIYLSGGSACSKGHLSPVLTAMGLPAEEIDSALRVSFGKDNTTDDVDKLADALADAIQTLTKRRAL
ncbi:MAG: cysteine desulfurase [Clostridia bacterium]|nr:cysteine desulfurase [Clostridia bacterium]